MVVFHSARFSDEGRHKRRFRFLVDLDRCSELIDPAPVRHDDLIRHLNRFILVMGDKDTRDPDFMYHFFQPAPQFVTHLRIDRRKRFIQK